MRSIPAALILLLFLMVSFVNSEGTLLCFGKDGHVAVEFVNACNGSGFGSQLAETESDACGPCTDVQLQSSPAYTNRTFNYATTQTHSLISPVLITPSMSLKEHRGSFLNLPEKPPYKTLSSLQSVVLLI